MKADLIKCIGIHQGDEGEEFKRLISFNDPDEVTHNILIPERYFLNKANRALKIMAYYGLMPHKWNRQAVNELIESQPLNECVEIQDIKSFKVVEVWTTKQALKKALRVSPDLCNT